MKQWRLWGLGLGCFVLGALVQSGLAQSRRPTFSPDLFRGKDAKTAATVLLDGALQLAEDGSWERIAVGRAWYPWRRQSEGPADLRRRHRGRQGRGQRLVSARAHLR